MKTKLVLLAIVVLVPLLHKAGVIAGTSRGGRFVTPSSFQTIQTSLRYNFEYSCNGERVVVTRCRKDSDMAGFPPTPPANDYCQVSYPDRPKRNGFTAMATELRGHWIKKLQACGAFKTDRPVTQANAPVGATQTAGTASVTKRPTGGSGGRAWEYLIDGAPTYAGPGSYVDPEKAQQLLNHRAIEGWELAAVGEGSYYFKRAR